MDGVEMMVDVGEGELMSVCGRVDDWIWEGCWVDVGELMGGCGRVDQWVCES